MPDITHLLDRAQQGDALAARDLLPLVYNELRGIAAAKMAGEAAGQTLQPTALVHEAWLRLAGAAGEARFQNRAHFFGAAGEAMRRILIDRARRRKAIRHGGGLEPLDLDGLEIPVPSDDDELLEVHEALDKLAEQEPVQAELVKLRYFIGMTNDEAARALSITARSAKHLWTHARAWLYQEIEAKRGRAPD